MRFSIFALTAASSTLLSLATSQYINPSEVPIAIRQNWCTSQISACPLICTQETNGSAATYANDCDPTTLGYDCVCSNGLSPNVSEYSQTIPYYTCTQFNNDCVTNCGLANNVCANNCRTSNPCGALNPSRVNGTSSTGTQTATSTGSGKTGSAVYTGFGTSATATGSSASSSGSSSSSTSNTSSSKSGAATLAIDMGRIYGSTLVVAGIFAGFFLI